MRAQQLTIISGVSGSGKSTALAALEDLGYFCIDNLPAPLIDTFVDFILALPGYWTGVTEFPTAAPHHSKFALLVDCRDEQSVRQVLKALKRLKAAEVPLTLLYFDCRDDLVLRRFQETRRPHPLLMAAGTQGSIADALAREREILSEFRERADKIFDTSDDTPHSLRASIQKFSGDIPRLEATVTSFGFKFGAPSDADLILDVRFLPNPQFVATMRERTGMEQDVRDYVFSTTDAAELLERYTALLSFLLPRYEKEGKRYLNIGVGCTGGKHRSVAIAEALAEGIRALSFSVSIRHRDRQRA
jgi:RNase adapter protein RapZ